MRVIAGSARGRQLKGPPSFATRPMTDKVKGALFNTLLSLGVEPDRILDLYAGTGAIGIEALSRGGSWATHPVANRVTFRNWDFPIRRQIFSGFRLAADV